MSLNWNISEVADWQQKQEKDDGLLECLIWATMPLGINNLTEKTADEFLYRWKRFTDEIGFLMSRNGEPVTPTKSELETWFGLSTNASKLTNKQFDDYVRKRSGR